MHVQCYHVSAMQSRGSYGFKNNLNASWVWTSTTCIWCVQGWNQRSSRKGRIPGADLERMCSGRGGGGPEHPPPWIIKIYISENNISRFSGVIRGNFVCLFQHFPAPFAHSIITSNSNESTCTIIRQYRSTILQNALEISRLCIIHILSTPGAEQLHFFVKPPTYIPVHSNWSESVKVRMCVQRIFRTVLNFLHFFQI